MCIYNMYLNQVTYLNNAISIFTEQKLKDHGYMQ